MFDVSINYDDVRISSIEKEDIKLLERWLNSQKCYMEQGEQFSIDYSELYQRFLEYYVSECEFFLKIIKADKLSGILKGRIEFKNPNEVWIGCFFIDNDMRNKGLGSSILKSIMLYFNKVYGIKDFFTGTAQKSEGNLRFWKNNGYKVIRVARDFYSFKSSNEDMLILKKTYDKYISV